MRKGYPCTSILLVVERNTPCTFILLVVERVHSARLHYILLLVERVTPCASILQVAEMYTSYTSILLAVERDTPCASILLREEVFMEGPLEPNMGPSLAVVLLSTFESTNARFSSFPLKKLLSWE